MARKRKRKGAAPKPASKPARVSTSLRGAIQGWKAELAAPDESQRTSQKGMSDPPSEPAPTPPRKPASEQGPSERDLDDRAALAKAMQGVRPLSRARKRRSSAPAEVSARSTNHVRHESARQEELARQRLDALVGGGVRFTIERDEAYVRGRRDGSHPRTAHRLGSDTCRPEARLDLHGLRSEEAQREVVRFVRAQQRRGARRVLIIHGKGRHSEAGHGVLADAVVETLTEGGAAPAVEAFSTAAPRHGGSGALVVQLV